eukprot:scaffold1348_cov142-Skeletonema_marinoi.AAC.6
MIYNRESAVLRDQLEWSFACFFLCSFSFCGQKGRGDNARTKTDIDTGQYGHAVGQTFVGQMWTLDN